jgi:hypothetical protein
MMRATRNMVAAVMALLPMTACDRTPPTESAGEQRPGPPKTDEQLVQRVKSAVQEQLTADKAVELVGDLPNYDSDGRPNGVQFFERHDFLDGPDSTIAMSAIEKEAHRVLFWHQPIPPSNTDTSLKCVGIVWKKDGSVAYFSGEFWIPNHG